MNKSVAPYEVLTKIKSSQGGFTLVEVLVSVGIMVVFLPVVGSLLVNSQILASIAKHQIEAAYVAQQYLETQRQSPFITVPSGQIYYVKANQNVSATPQVFNVVLDSKGNYNNSYYNNANYGSTPGNVCTTTNVFCGTMYVSVTSTIYNYNAANPSTSTTTDHVVVQIDWSENKSGHLIPMTENFAEDIVNDPMLN